MVPACSKILYDPVYIHRSEKLSDLIRPLGVESWNDSGCHHRKKGGEQIHNILDLAFFLHPHASGLRFQQSQLRSHFILGAAHLWDKSCIYAAEGQRCVHKLHHQV